MAETREDGIGGFAKTAIVLGVILGLGLLALAVLYRPFTMVGGSMMPAYGPGDILVVDRRAYGLRWRDLPIPLDREGRIGGGEMPARGDVVLFENPRDGNRSYLMRVVGLPGETVAIRKGVVHVDGTPATLTPAGEVVESLDTRRSQLCLDRRVEDGARLCFKDAFTETLPGGATHTVLNADPNLGRMDNTPDLAVPEGHYFLMGDNRDNAADSRTPRVGTVPFSAIVGRATDWP